MKKLISLILCFVIAASVSLTAFAVQTVAPGDVKSVTLKKGQYAEYSFTAPEAAVYQITLRALNKSWASVLAACENNERSGVQIEVSYDNISDMRLAEGYFTTCEGYKYKISVSNNADMLDEDERKELGVSDTAELEFSIKKIDLPKVELGGTYTVKGTITDFLMDNEYFCMMPKTSGYYNFRSQSEDPVAPQIEILSDECTSKFGGGYHKPFDVTVYMEKDHLYLIAVSAIAFAFGENEYDPDTLDTFDTEFTFSVSDGSNIPVESITPNEEKISMRKNWYDIGHFTISPSGFTPFDTEDVTVTSSNPWVADTSNHYLFHNDFSFEIDAYHYGRTTITVTLPNGMSSSMKVYVKPRIIVMLEDFFATFFGWKV